MLLNVLEGAKITKNGEYLNGIATYRRIQLRDIHTYIMLLKVMNDIKLAAFLL